MTFFRSRRSAALGICLASLLGFTALLTPAASEAVVSTYSVSNCASNKAEDPANMHFSYVYIHYGLTYSAGADATRHMSNKYWDAPFTGNSGSWYFFSDYPCHDSWSYVANHAPMSDGSHVRFWQDGANTANVRSATHKDHYCGGFTDTSYDFITPRNNLSLFWWNLQDIYGAYGYTFEWTYSNIAKYWSKGCNQMVYDDGYIGNVTQLYTFFETT